MMKSLSYNKKLDTKFVMNLNNYLQKSKIKYNQIRNQSIFESDLFKEYRKGVKEANNDIWFLLALSIGCIERIYYITQPIKYDESFTFINFVNQANPFRLFWYGSSNNHLLNTLLIKLSTFIFGKNLISIRLPSLLVGIACIYMIYILCKQLGQSGRFAAFAIATCPYLISYSTNGRGYSLIVFFTILMISVSLKIINDSLKPNIYYFSLFASLGLFSIPTMLFPILGIYIWLINSLIIHKKSFNSIFKQLLLPSILLTTFITSILYIPTFITSKGLGGGSKEVQSLILKFDDFIAQIIPNYIYIFKSLSGSIPLSIMLLFSLLFILGLIKVFRINLNFILLLPSFLFASLIIILIMKFIPYDRTMIYLIPVFIVISDYGFTSISSTSNKFIYRISLISLITSALITCQYTFKSNEILSLGEQSYPESPVIVKFLQEKSINDQPLNIITSIIDAGPLMYYQWYYGANLSINGIKLSSSELNLIEGLNNIKIDIQKYLGLIPRFSFEENNIPTNKLFITHNDRNTIHDLTKFETKEIFSYGNMSIYESFDNN